MACSQTSRRRSVGLLPSFLSRERERGGGRRQRTPHVRFRNAFLKLCRRCYCFRMKDTRDTNQKTTLNNGYLGSRIDEERSEMRYVV
jgi:ribosome-binding protein aMBF1 (putative translation factor)